MRQGQRRRRGVWTIQATISRAWGIAIATCRIIVKMARVIMFGSAEAGRATLTHEADAGALKAVVEVQLRTAAGATVGDAMRAQGKT